MTTSTSPSLLDWILHLLGDASARSAFQADPGGYAASHGFTDVSDRVFDRLWSADGLTWAELVAASEEAEAARPAAPAKDRPKGRAKAAPGRT